jgi:DNA-binding MarR family transcriptional regulator
MDRSEIVETMRRFGRFYTVSLGVLDQNYLGTGFSLTEMRIIFEIDWNSGISAKQLSELLRLDKSYISRIIRSFEQRSLVDRCQSSSDRRSFELSLTREGRAASELLRCAVQENIENLLRPLDEERQNEAASAMERIMAIFEEKENQI